jgi:hypothetical protein
MPRIRSVCVRIAMLVVAGSSAVEPAPPLVATEHVDSKHAVTEDLRTAAPS